MPLMLALAIPRYIFIGNKCPFAPMILYHSPLHLCNPSYLWPLSNQVWWQATKTEYCLYYFPCCTDSLAVSLRDFSLLCDNDGICLSVINSLIKINHKLHRKELLLILTLVPFPHLSIYFSYIKLFCCSIMHQRF